MEEVTLRSLIDTVTACSSAGKRYCFILGAGASRASGIKTGAEMAKEWLDEMEKNEPKILQEWIEKNDIDIKDPSSYYSKIYEQRFRLDPASGFIRLQNEMEKAIPSPGYYYLAEIIDSTQNKLVITTNFDSLTEDSLFIYKDKNALVITHESLAKYIDALAKRPTVIKLHRDLLLQPKSGEADVNILSEEWKSSLQKIMDIYVPIIIGYGGNDGSLMGFLEKTASKEKIIYWCYKRDNPVNERIKKLLEQYRGFLIPIDDFDDTMYNIGEHFGYKISEEIIRKVTSEYAEKLINKYNEWRKNKRESFFEKRTAKEQENAIYYNETGDEYYFKNDYSKAIEYYTQAIELEANNARYYNNRGVSYQELKAYKKAIADQSKAIELEPNNALYNNNRGITYQWLNEYEKSIADISKAIELEPNNARYYNNRGINYQWLNEYEKSIADISKAIELEPYNARYYNSRGVSYRWLNEYEKSVMDQSKAIELEPDNTKYYLSLARILCRTSDFDNAHINLNKAMFMDNNQANCYNVRGFIGMKKAKQDKVKCKSDVLDDLNKAIELNDDNSLANRFYRDRAEYYLYSNEPDKAHNDLQKAVALNDMDGLSYFLMARYYEIKGNTQEYDRCMAKMKECRYFPDSSDF
jgi:tetratricopeptide (TPR) repeat protein